MSPARSRHNKSLRSHRTTAFRSTEEIKRSWDPLNTPLDNGARAMKLFVALIFGVLSIATLATLLAKLLLP